MRILIVLTYYRPHTSGLTIYAERLAEALARRGHAVTVLTSQFDEQLSTDEMRNGVHIIRVPVMFRLSKGVVMPQFGRIAHKLIMEHDVIQLHLPQFDAAGVAMRGRLFHKPTVITYHCDLRMPPGLLSWLANQAVRVMNNTAALFTHRIVTYTEDYAIHSSYLKRYLKKLRVIPPPVELPKATEAQIGAFAEQNNPQMKHPVIGMAARFATEKGVEVLVNALPLILEKYPEAVVHFAGPYKKLIGEEAYFERLAPKIDQFEKNGHWKFLGLLDPQQMSAFYPNIDLLVLSSLNSTEAFGLVQIEAMINGVPCVASDLPGVRQPVKRHGMGKIIPIGDAAGLAHAAIEILAYPTQFIKSAKEIEKVYLPDTIAIEYEKLFDEMFKELGKSPVQTAGFKTEHNNQSTDQL